MKDLIEIAGYPKWIKIKNTKTMYFKVDKWHKRVRLEFAINNPFDFATMIDLQKDEAEQLIKQLQNAVKNSKEVED